MTRRPIFLTDEEVLLLSLCAEKLAEKNPDKIMQGKLYAAAHEIKSQNLLGQGYAKFTANLTADADKVRSGRTV